MPSPDDVHVLVKSAEAEQALADAPKAFNQGFNRELQGIGGEFSREFTRRSLGAGGVVIRRQARSRARAPYQPYLTRPMRAAGFKSRIKGSQKLDGKRLSMRTKSPVMLGLELGGTIAAKTSPGLAIPFSQQSDSVGKDERKGAFLIRRGGSHLLVVRQTGHRGAVPVSGYGWQHYASRLVPLAFYRQQILMKPRLRFLATWDSFQPRAIERLDNSVLQTLKRLGKGPGAPVVLPAWEP